MEFYINGRLQSTNIVNLYNLGVFPINGIGIYIFPRYFMKDIAGFDETINANIWLLEPKTNGQHKISIKLDDYVTYPLLKDMAGARTSLPIVYYRTASPLIESLYREDELGNQVVITPLYGNDTTIYGQDWEKSRNSQATFPLDSEDSHFIDHLLNYPTEGFDDLLKFELIINADQSTETALYNNIISALVNCSFMIAPTIYNKSITSAYELNFSEVYTKYNDTDQFGIRY